MDKLKQFIGNCLLVDLTAELLNDVCLEFAIAENPENPRYRSAKYMMQVLSALWTHAKSKDETLISIRSRTNPCSYVDNIYKGGKGPKRWPQELINFYIYKYPKYALKKDVLGRRIPLKVESLQRLILHMWQSGQRLQDIVDMEWSQYKQIQGNWFFTFNQKKIEKEMTVYVSSTLQNALKMWSNENDIHFLEPTNNPKLIHTSHTGVPWTTDNAQKRLRFARKQVENHPAILEMNKKIPGFDIHNYTFHGLRHSAISNLVEAHSTPEEVQAFSGHQSKRMVEHYSREKNTREMSLRAVKKAEQYVNGGESK